ncbi:MAG: aminotransferase class III-fold pyridoxal phosphate-dependent enzyme, partial [Victivallaceae bacterium]
MSKMTASELTEKYQNYVMPTYAPTLLLVRGEGCNLWDIDNNRYLDFGAGISVCNLGHCHPAVTQAIAQQAAT